ncbi:MAG TPA: ribonuclease P protein component [Gammaproteobacteria bacterium]|nr:ribonuclease P protein component [Gammaproteobacteria bacterium]
MPVTPSGQMFPREVRLLNAKQYSYVFADARRFGNQSFTLLVRLNDQSHPRLGLAIAKKSVKRAVDRNRIKRLLRESFRHKQHQLPPIDIIAMCRPVVVQLNNEQILRQLEKQWCYMQKKLTYQHAR